MLTPWKKSYDQPRKHIEKQRYSFAKGLSSQDYGFSSSHVWMWELNYNESWALQNWCFWTVVLEKLLGLKGDAASPSERKSVLNVHWKDWCWSWNLNSLATWYKELTHFKRPWWERLRAWGEGDDRGWDGWKASLTQWTWVRVYSGVGDGQGVLACCNPWGHKESDITEQLNWTEQNVQDQE